MTSGGGSDLILDTLRFALDTFTGTCDCGECGPCEAQRDLEDAIGQRERELQTGVVEPWDEGNRTASKPIVPFDVDHATYVGDEQDGVYYQTQEGPDGWYVTTVVDCNTAHFTDTLERDAGPFDTERDAEEYGENAAIDWCEVNGVIYDDEPED